MTEWTLDLIEPSTQAEGDASVGIVKSPPDMGPYVDLVADTLVDDVQLDLEEWFV